MSDPVTTSKEWDQVRKAFQTSLMIDTSLHSLAQNLEGPEWPDKSKDDTPSKYVDMDLEELSDYFALKNQPPARIDQLVNILRETLAFDQPFGEMVEQVQASAEKDNTLLKNLTRMEVPETYPVELTGLSLETKDFCRLEKLNTLGEFAVFAQSMSQNVIVGGDFRTLLNALSQSDVDTLSRFIPVRPGTKGLHLPEAIVVYLRTLPSGIRCAIAQKSGATLTPAQMQESLLVPKEKVAAALADLRLKVSRMASEFYQAELAQMQIQTNEGTKVERLTISLGDSHMEAIVNEQLRQILKPLQTNVAPSAKKAGFWARLFGRA